MESRSDRWWDWLSAGLMLALLITSASRLDVTGWTDHLEYVQRLAVLGCVLGVGLGYSLFRRGPVILLATAYSLTIVPHQLSLIIPGDLRLGERLLSLGGRLWFSLTEFAASQPVEDELFFVALLGLTYWILGLVSSYWLMRRSNFLAAVLPAGLVMLIVQTYDAVSLARVWFLGFYLLLALLLLARLNYLRRRGEWRERRVFISPENGVDLNNSALAAAILLVVIAWSLPSALSKAQAASDAWDEISRPWRTLRDRLSDAFAALEGSGTGGVELYGDLLALGSGNELSDEVLFTANIQSSSRDLPRYYWRGRVYDRFVDGIWTSTAVVRQSFDPEEGSLTVDDPEGWRVANFFFTVRERQYTFYLPSQPVWVSRPGNALFFNIPESDAVDLVWIRSDFRLEGGDIYQASAMIVNPSVRQLREAGAEYPDWVLERYLQLPDDFSPRITALAGEITFGMQSPYDKAAAITQYLRENIEYATTIPEIPEDVDPLEWVLFDLRQGFCNYYATAEVLMLRSQGVPARLATGYAEGEPDDFARKFTVRAYDAHAWPEVYFPGIGWVEFEPTGNQDPLRRPPGVESNPDAGNDAAAPGGLLPPGGAGGQDELPEDIPVDIPEDSVAVPRFDPRALFAWSAFIAGLALLIVAWRAGWLGRAPARAIAALQRRDMEIPAWLTSWDRLAGSGPVTRSFEAVNLSLRLLGEPPPPHATPSQRASVLTDLLPEAGELITVLASEQQADQYSPRQGDPTQAQRAALQLLPLAFRAAVEKRMEAFQRRFGNFG